MTQDSATFIRTPDRLMDNNTTLCANGPQSQTIPVAPFTFAMLKSPTVTRKHDYDILKNITVDRGFVILGIIKRVLQPSEIMQFYHQHVDKPYYRTLHESVGDMIIGLKLGHIDPKVDVITAWRNALGSTDSRKADPTSIRGMWGGHRYWEHAPMADNVAHGSDSWPASVRELSIVFGNPVIV